MTTLLDVTLQHTGWASPDFALAGWDELHTLPAGFVARSFFAKVLNGQPQDVYMYYPTESFTAPPTPPLFLNTHMSGAASGSISPPYTTTPNTHIWVGHRLPTQTTQGTVRYTISDQPQTPDPSRPFCEFGTEAIDPTIGTQLVTAEVVSSVLAATGFPELAVAFVPVVGTLLVVKELCSGLPPPMPVLQEDGSFKSVFDAVQAFKALAWRTFCRCSTGTPAPVPVPPPVLAIPPGLPSPPAFPCDPADLCSSISAIRQQVFSISTVLAEMSPLLTLLQRYGLPFAAVPGAMHSALAGEGGFAISRLLGFEVDVASKPADVRVLEGNPPYLWNLGWMSVSDSNGMVQEKRITRDKFTWLPEGCQFATTFTFFLFPGVSINVRELQAET